MKTEGSHVIADEGFKLKRKDDNDGYHDDIWLSPIDSVANWEEVAISEIPCDTDGLAT